jgi:hypothetical protein
VNNGYMVVTGVNHQIAIQHTCQPVLIPPDATDIRFSLVSYQPTRERPQFGWQMFAFWTDAHGRGPAPAGLSYSAARDEWPQIEIDEGLPKAGHTVGEAYGIVPHDVGPFPFEREQSPSVDGNDRPEWATHAFVRYTLLGGNNGGPVYVSVVAEAFAHDLATGNTTPLEFA